MSNLLVYFYNSTLDLLNRMKYLPNLPIERPWGCYQEIFSNENEHVDQEDITNDYPIEDLYNFKIKILKVNRNSRLSLQSHDFRSEHWVIVKGQAEVIVEEDKLTLSKNQHIYIPKGSKHRITNIGRDVLVLVETQIGDYLGEDDITRYQDDYGRN